MPQIVVVLAALLAGGIVALLAERAFHASGRSGLHLRSLRSTSRLTRAPVQPSPEEFEAIRRAYTLFVSIERSALSRVIGVGASQIAHGLTVEFISVELRESGGRGFLRVHSREGFRVQPNPERHHEPEPPSVQDDVGMDYAVSWSARSGSGDDDYSEATAEFLFAPIPPEGARRLRVSIPRSDPFADRLDPQKEPWIFDVAL
jgi:hypothetical protein